MITETPAVHAFVDESEPRMDLDPGVYVLAAAVLQTTALSESRVIMDAHRRPGGRKAHWHETRSSATRLALVEAAGTTGAHLSWS